MNCHLELFLKYESNGDFYPLLKFARNCIFSDEAYYWKLQVKKKIIWYLNEINSYRWKYSLFGCQGFIEKQVVFPDSGLYLKLPFHKPSYIQSTHISKILSFKSSSSVLCVYPWDQKSAPWSVQEEYMR